MKPTYMFSKNNDRFGWIMVALWEVAWIMVDFYIALFDLRTSILSVFYAANSNISKEGQKRDEQKDKMRN